MYCMHCEKLHIDYHSHLIELCHLRHFVRRLQLQCTSHSTLAIQTEGLSSASVIFVFVFFFFRSNKWCCEFSDSLSSMFHGIAYCRCECDDVGYARLHNGIRTHDSRKNKKKNMRKISGMSLQHLSMIELHHPWLELELFSIVCLSLSKYCNIFESFGTEMNTFSDFLVNWFLYTVRDLCFCSNAFRMGCDWIENDIHQRGIYSSDGTEASLNDWMTAGDCTKLECG